MIAEKMKGLVANSSAIRAMFEEGNRLAGIYGAENVFDFSLGNSVDEYYRPRKRYRNLATPKEPIKPKDPAVRYLESRGISAEIARRYEITVQRDYDNILVFPFFDESGKLRFVKYRKTDFDPETDKNKEWCEANCKPILFGMKQCSENRERLIITEGQLGQVTAIANGMEK